MTNQELQKLVASKVSKLSQSKTPHEILIAIKNGSLPEDYETITTHGTDSLEVLYKIANYHNKPISYFITEEQCH